MTKIMLILDEHGWLNSSIELPCIIMSKIIIHDPSLEID